MWVGQGTGWDKGVIVRSFPMTTGIPEEKTAINTMKATGKF